MKVNYTTIASQVFQRCEF